MAEVDAKAQALVAKACGWVASNPDTWAKLRRICYRLMLEATSSSATTCTPWRARTA